jgi:phosphohistidine swiveling domain-containing protein/tetratricopeptide (TPR) repeat protein
MTAMTNALPIPADFPVSWQHPDDPHKFWRIERMHWPEPIPPLDFEFMRDAHEELTAAFADYGVPLQYEPRHFNYRWYESVNPAISDMSEMPARMQRGLQNLEDAIARVKELWENEWLPEVEQHLAIWEAFPLTEAHLPELMAHFEDTIARHKRVWRIHFRQTFPVYMAMSAFDDLYNDLFGSEQALESYRLTQGFANKTTEIGRAFWKLSRKALASPSVANIVTERDLADIIAALGASDEGRAFLQELDAFLAVNGQRGGSMGVSFTSWIEDPTPALQILREYVRHPERDPDAELAATAAAREQAIAEARARLASYPQAVIAQFEDRLRYAQQATIISEDHNYYIDFAEIYQVRRVLLEIGRRFVQAGVLDAADDIFLLTCDELRATAQALPAIGRQAIVATRKAEIEHFRALTPPSVLGTLPSAPPPDDPLTRTLMKFFGDPPVAPERTPEGTVLRGGAGSAGRVQGIARVITSLADAERLGAGDILVAPTTAPAWTPLFATAAAVVTETGGVLSHSAVVAREYQIPAVVGVGMATDMIRDGQMLEVDGDQGIVRIIG